MSAEKRVPSPEKRASELERRAWQGTDDVAYCVKWAGIHRRLAAILHTGGAS